MAEEHARAQMRAQMNMEILAFAGPGFPWPSGPGTIRTFCMVTMPTEPLGELASALAPVVGPAPHSRWAQHQLHCPDKKCRQNECRLLPDLTTLMTCSSCSPNQSASSVSFLTQHSGHLRPAHPRWYTRGSCLCPSCFHCVLLSCFHVFGISITVKLQN